MSHFEEAVAQVLKAEGGLLISDSEHGGGANFGVSLSTLRSHRKNEDLTLQDLAAMTIDEAREIYRERFWNQVCGDQIVGRLSAIAILDQAVNRGVVGVKNQISATLAARYNVVVAGQPVSKLIDAVNAIDDRQFFRRFICDCQHAYVTIATGDSKKAKWLKGWLVRTHNLLKLLV